MDSTDKEVTKRGLQLVIVIDGVGLIFILLIADID